MSSQGHKGQRAADAKAEDPERLLIAAELAEAAKSAAQLAEATGLPLAHVRRHLRQMREEEAIESLARQSKRGTVEHFYFLVGGLWKDRGELEELSLDERRRFHGSILKLVLTEASRALVTHPTERGLERLDVAITRIPIHTDEAGWEELAELHQDFYDRVLEARERIEARLEKEGQKGFKASSALLFFEAETTD